MLMRRQIGYTYFIERHSVWCPGIKMDSANGNVQTEGFQGFSYTGRRNYRTWYPYWFTHFDFGFLSHTLSNDAIRYIALYSQQPLSISEKRKICIAKRAYPIITKLCASLILSFFWIKAWWQNLQTEKWASNHLDWLLIIRILIRYILICLSD